MIVRIYKPTRSTMQSGLAGTRFWIVEFPPRTGSLPDPLMGWTSTRDTRPQVRLRFGSRDEAVAYAVGHGLAYDLEEPQERSRKAISYGSNFSSGRLTPFTH